MPNIIEPDDMFNEAQKRIDEWKKTITPPDINGLMAGVDASFSHIAGLAESIGDRHLAELAMPAIDLTPIIGTSTMDGLMAGVDASFSHIAGLAESIGDRHLAELAMPAIDLTPIMGTSAMDGILNGVGASSDHLIGLVESIGDRHLAELAMPAIDLTPIMGTSTMDGLIAGVDASFSHIAGLAESIGDRHLAELAQVGSMWNSEILNYAPSYSVPDFVYNIRSSDEQTRASLDRVADEIHQLNETLKRIHNLNDSTDNPSGGDNS